VNEIDESSINIVRDKKGDKTGSAEKSRWKVEGGRKTKKFRCPGNEGSSCLTFMKS
jgi:hypothetical protein